MKHIINKLLDKMENRHKLTKGLIIQRAVEILFSEFKYSPQGSPTDDELAQANATTEGMQENRLESFY